MQTLNEHTDIDHDLRRLGEQLRQAASGRTPGTIRPRAEGYRLTALASVAVVVLAITVAMVNVYSRGTTPPPSAVPILQGPGWTVSAIETAMTGTTARRLVSLEDETFGLFEAAVPSPGGTEPGELPVEFTGYDPQSQSSQRLTPPPRPISDDDLIVTSASTGVLLLGSSRSDPFLQYTPESDTWSSLPVPPLPDNLVAQGALSETHLYVWGTVPNDPSQEPVFARYAVAEEEWEILDAGPLATRWYHAVAWTGGRIVVWGGTDALADQGSGASYNPDNGEWAPLPDGMVGRSHASLVTTVDGLLVLGGTQMSSPVSEVYELGQASNEWSVTDATAIVAGNDVRHIEEAVLRLSEPLPPLPTIGCPVDITVSGDVALASPIITGACGPQILEHRAQ